ncbi:Hypothetical_protein [Hexamita inflata]|uniref:Hypothetical_protein n=1 Tax=Hexamita inflata TaxID=28002 RepID=A0AA86PG10_9EUKA|nr:Hypothetical protein HINF_LOCUS22719 [Hexamita inflata]
MLLILNQVYFIAVCSRDQLFFFLKRVLIPLNFNRSLALFHLQLARCKLLVPVYHVINAREHSGDRLDILYRTNWLLFIISYANILNRLSFQPKLRILWSVQSLVSETSYANFNMKQALSSLINLICNIIYQDKIRDEGQRLSN